MEIRESSFVAKGFVILAQEVLVMAKEAKKKTPQTTNNGTKGKLSHYKSRPEKKRYTKEERELIAIWRGLFEAMDRQERSSE